MLGMFLKGLVGGAARGFSTAIKTRNKELRDMWDTAQQKYMDTIARETQQRTLQRTQLLERMGRIESKGPAGTLTPAELYLLSKDDQTFGQVINDLDKGLLDLAQVKKNIAFNGKSSPKYATKEQAIEANYDPSLAVRPRVVSTKTAFGLESGIQQQRAQDLEAIIPSDSMIAKDAQGQPLQRVTGSYKPAIEPEQTTSSAMRNSLNNALRNYGASDKVLTTGNKRYVVNVETDPFGAKPPNIRFLEEGKKEFIKTTDKEYVALIKKMYKNIADMYLQSYGTKEEPQYISTGAAQELKNFFSFALGKPLQDINLFDKKYYIAGRGVSTNVFRDAIDQIEIKGTDTTLPPGGDPPPPPPKEVTGEEAQKIIEQGMAAEPAKDAEAKQRRNLGRGRKAEPKKDVSNIESYQTNIDPKAYLKQNKDLIEKYYSNKISKAELEKLQEAARQYGSPNDIDTFINQLLKDAGYKGQ